MKRFIILLLVCAVVFAGCAQEPLSEQPEEIMQTEPPETTTTPPETTEPPTTTTITTTTISTTTEPPTTTPPPVETPPIPESIAGIDWAEAYWQTITHNEFINNFTFGFQGLSLYDFIGKGFPQLLIHGHVLGSFFHVYKFNDNEVFDIGSMSTMAGGIYKLPDYDSYYSYGWAGPYGNGRSITYYIVDEKIIVVPEDERMTLSNTVREDYNPPDAGFPWFFYNGEKITEEEYDRLFDEYFNEENRIPIEIYDMDNIEQMFLDYLKEHE